MADVALLGGLQSEQTNLWRVRYFPRQLLTADDMVTDQDYCRQKQRRHNRFLHGWGVVCGLEVVADATPELPWRVQIGAGYALGPYGDEIFVGESFHIDLAQCGPGTVTDPCEPALLHPGGGAIGNELFLAIKYAECKARPVRAMPAGCACEEEVCEYSRIRESFQIECLTELPPSHQPSPPGPSLCDLLNNHQLPPCPPCPAEPWVVLARVTLPPSPATNIANANIDNITFRRQIYSTALLQEQLIRCCCIRPVQVVRIDPPPGREFNLTFDNRPSSIVVTFNKRLQPDTVNENTVRVTLATQTVTEDVPGTVSYDDSTQSMTFEPSEPFPFRTSTVTVTLIGTGSNPILDVDDLELDGDGDGSAGGDFTSQFTLISPQM